jgi:protein-disulfide isomerase
MNIAGRLSAAALILLSVPVATASKPAAKADWTHTYGVTSAGGFRVGNPKAKVAVVEYGSLTCPHCRHFAQTAVKPLLDQYVKTGKASYEFRPFLLNGLDLAATLLARCGGPSRFFPMAEQLYATQPTWSAKVVNLPKSEQEKLEALPQGQMPLAMAKLGGLLPVAAAHGIPPAKAEQCLKDENAANALAKIEQAGTDLGVTGTPAIFVNDKQVPVYDWATLQPFLKGSGG